MVYGICGFDQNKIIERFKQHAAIRINLLFSHQRLTQLEKLEETNENAEVTVKTEVEDEQEEEAEMIEEDEDEEMDDGTDYANNYFDNGEAYEEEDDNLDDGPIY